MIAIYQVYFDFKSKQAVSPCFIPFNNTRAGENKKYFEHHVMMEVYNSQPVAEWIGITSWRFTEKSKLNPIDLLLFIEKLTDTQAVIYHPFFKPVPRPWIKSANKEVAEVAWLLDTFNVLPVKLLDADWYAVHCNYWVAKTEVYNKFIEQWLKPTMDFLEIPEIDTLIKDKTFRHRGENIPIHTFLLERLFGVFMLTEKLTWAHPALTILNQTEETINY